VGPASAGGRRLRRPAARRSGRVLCSSCIFSTMKCMNETVGTWLVARVSRVRWSRRDYGGGALSLKSA
jgi:uncharacterized heparinase superfamily protein